MVTLSYLLEQQASVLLEEGYTLLTVISLLKQFFLSYFKKTMLKFNQIRH